MRTLETCVITLRTLPLTANPTHRSSRLFRRLAPVSCYRTVGPGVLFPSGEFDAGAVPRSVSPFRPLATPIGVNRVEGVFLAGVPVKSSLVLELAARVKDPELARRLEQGVKRDLIVIRLYADEQADLLKALDDPPAGLEAVRDALVEARARDKRDEPAAENAA